MEWCLSGRKELTANELRATPPQVRILSTPRDPFQMDKCSSRLCTACWGSGQRAWSQHDCFVLAHGLVAPNGRAPRSHRGGCVFESRQVHLISIVRIAQMVARLHHTEKVVGSSPAASTQG